MRFREILLDLLQATPGAIGAVFLDSEGESVDVVSARPFDTDDHELRVIGAYAGIFLSHLRRIAEATDSGTARRFKIDFAASPFFVNTQGRDWPAGDRPRLAAVNSLGLGGTNAFVVLEEPPAAAEKTAKSHFGLFTLSARTDAALRASIERHLTSLSRDQTPLPDICFTSTSGRTHFPVRFAAVVGSKEQLRRALAAESGNGATPERVGERRLAFLFSGQASQYARMGADLYRRQPVFRQEVDRCAEIVGNRLGQPLTDVLLGDDADSILIDETAYTQPALFAVQAGLIALWRSWGVHDLGRDWLRCEC